ncbi:Flp family type IVb pilin [Pseudomonas sp. NW5]|uniref:Flp family type IVb pilin n=1 Tax=Pseudomonas sp. NW5 TaxID=2934934 RepID=UPI002021CC46|nr:Flp family type IVb pilin [Pseudomonas sp. NW5]MCL7462312.1 Flp family type IVb pilin [Pseudomonas sp. NW5]
MSDKMLSLYCKAKAFLSREDGASAIEYGIIAGLIALAFIVAATAVGTDLSDLFTKVSEKLQEGTAKAN